ncbi:PREDICTED: uncharacterized protein LOC105452928 [Wasmannia auropunctata]|uniref:uncharacterized protein LOC105452928 n=1 Tax=Wasmannia auropunctata TaxID=64793 RepID=UPI0005EDCD7A|nr:PREDICTED: uncharacterized protein LOC105452928 [Wasmannia auropunctata]
MKTIIFVACILATVTAGDALILDFINTLTSKIFNIKDLMDYHITYAGCALKLGLLKIYTPEIFLCIAEQKNLIDEEGALKWNETQIYITKLVRNENKLADITAWFKKCKEISDNFEGSKKEKTMKAFECGLPLRKYVMQQPIL